MNIHELRRLNKNQKEKNENFNRVFFLNNVWKKNIEPSLEKAIEKIKQDYIKGKDESEFFFEILRIEAVLLFDNYIESEINGKIVRYINKKYEINSKVEEIRFEPAYLSNKYKIEKNKMRVRIIFKEVEENDS